MESLKIPFKTFAALSKAFGGDTVKIGDCIASVVTTCNRRGLSEALQYYSRQTQLALIRQDLALTIADNFLQHFKEAE